MRDNILKVILELIRERYPEAKAVFWAGSTSRGENTEHSDLDLVIIFTSLPNAYRESFIYKGWPIDAFVHDLNTLVCFCENESKDGRPALTKMVLDSYEILAMDGIAEKAKALAKRFSVRVQRGGVR